MGILKIAKLKGILNLLINTDFKCLFVSTNKIFISEDEENLQFFSGFSFVWLPFRAGTP